LGRWPLLAALLFLLVVALTACTRDIGGVSSGWNALAVGNEVVYVGTKDGRVQALTDRGDGDFPEKWSYPASQESGVSLRGVYSTPLLASGLLYVTAENGYLYALDPENGSVSERGWRRPLGQAEDLAPLVAGPAYEPVNRLILVASEDGNLYSYDAETGEPVWKPFETGDKIWSTPAVGNLDGLPAIYFGSHDGNVYAVDAADGSELWRFETGGVVAGKPLLLDRMVIVGSFDKKLYALDALDGSKLWEFEAGNWFWAGAVSNGATIFAPNMDGRVYALDHSGLLEWEFDAGSQIVSAPVLVPRGLVVANREGDLILVDVSRDSGQRELHKLTLGDAEIKAPLYAEGNSVYVGSDDGSARRIEVHEQFSEAVLTARACWNHDEECR
jgi:outer membrane protein assembly factor BamB